MIDLIRGKIISKLATYVVVDVGGVGYGVHIPLSTFTRLKDLNSEALLHTRVYIRDDNIQIYGFHSAAEKELFLILNGVSGVGPRMALGILSALTPEQFTSAVACGDLDALTSVPGIGRKKAERLLLELKDKLRPDMPEALEPAHGQAGTRKASEAVAALTYLGCGSTEASKAVRSAADALAQDAPIEDIIREALKHL